ARRHRVVVGIERDAKLLGGARRAHAREVKARGVEPLQMSAFFFKAIDRALVGRLVHAHVGYRVYPQRSRGLHRGEVSQLEASQEILFNVADSILNPSLLVAAAYVAGADLETPMA